MGASAFGPPMFPSHRLTLPAFFGSITERATGPNLFPEVASKRKRALKYLPPLILICGPALIDLLKDEGGIINRPVHQESRRDRRRNRRRPPNRRRPVLPNRRRLEEVK